MDIILSIISILLTIIFVIGTHEYAHFISARMLKVKVLKFSIGFGKTIYRWTDRLGTEFVIALIPLGGYVKMVDENEGPVLPEELPNAFNRQPFYKKFLIVAAGPLTNIFCAFLLYWLIFVIGFTTIKPIIGQVSTESIAAYAGLKPKQEIIAVDDKFTNGWPNILFRILTHVGNKDVASMTVKSANGALSSHQLDLSNWHINDLNPDPLKSLGITPLEPEVPLVIGVIAKHSPAENTLQMGDKIIAVNDKQVQDWLELNKLISNLPDQTIRLTILRNNKIQNIPITIGVHHHWIGKNKGYLGIAPIFKWPKNLLHKVKYNPKQALKQAWQEVVDLTYFNLLLFGKLITGKISLQSLGGPITIFETAGNALQAGLLAFIGFLAFLSISIGIINLLPIPGLDGGHLLIYSIEAILGRPIPFNILALIFRLGFIFIFLLLIQALVNDFLRL